MYNLPPPPRLQDAQSDRLVEVELTENRLRTCRAERMVLENERVTRLRSLLTSPRPQEPDKITFDLSPDERKRVCLLVHLCIVLYL